MPDQLEVLPLSTRFLPKIICPRSGAMSLQELSLGSPKIDHHSFDQSLRASKACSGSGNQKLPCVRRHRQADFTQNQPTIRRCAQGLGRESTRVLAGHNDDPCRLVHIVQFVNVRHAPSSAFGN